MRQATNFSRRVFYFGVFISLFILLIGANLVVFCLKLIPIKVDNAKLLVEIADTPEKKAMGLSKRKSLSKNSGVLFIFSPPQIASFWMKDMHFPIDLIFIDENCEVSEIFNNLGPESFPQVFTSKTAIKYALEVNSDFVEKHLIKAGSRLKIQRKMDRFSCD